MGQGTEALRDGAGGSQDESCGSQRGSGSSCSGAPATAGIFAPADNVAFAYYASCIFNPSLSLGNVLARPIWDLTPGRPYAPACTSLLARVVVFPTPQHPPETSPNPAQIGGLLLIVNLISEGRGYPAPLLGAAARGWGCPHHPPAHNPLWSGRPAAVTYLRFLAHFFVSSSWDPDTFVEPLRPFVYISLVVLGSRYSC